MPIVGTMKGDLVEFFKKGEFDAIAHGCNCFHTMGAGIAKQIAKEFPRALDVDQNTTGYGDFKKLGGYSSVITEFGTIYNAYTQLYPGREDEDRLYVAIQDAFTWINKDNGNGLVLGIPKIGAGLAGGNWGTIEGIIDRVSTKLSIVVVEFQK